MPSEAGSPSSGCRATHRNSIRSSTSGVIGSITLYPTSARTISLSSATRPAEPYAACADVRPSSDPSGIKLNCHYNMQDSNRCSRKGVWADRIELSLEDPALIGRYRQADHYQLLRPRMRDLMSPTGAGGDGFS